MTTLPKKYKKQIIELTNRYYELARPRKIIVSIKETLPVKIVWDEENRIRLNEESECAYDIHDYLYASKEFKKQNEKIQSFIDETIRFGKKNFDDPDWLWSNVLRNFRPENNDKFNFKKVRWVNDYE